MSIYEFGPAERIVDSVAIRKPSGAVELLQIDDEWESKLDFYLPSEKCLKGMPKKVNSRAMNVFARRCSTRCKRQSL